MRESVSVDNILSSSKGLSDLCLVRAKLLWPSAEPRQNGGFQSCQTPSTSLTSLGL
jgi:hypothetical protein